MFKIIRVKDAEEGGKKAFEIIKEGMNKGAKVLGLATGSTPVRTRIYRMGMSKYYDQMEADFNVFGELEDDWERFEKNKSYKAFMVSIKQK